MPIDHRDNEGNEREQAQEMLKSCENIKHQQKKKRKKSKIIWNNNNVSKGEG